MTNSSPPLQIKTIKLSTFLKGLSTKVLELRPVGENVEAKPPLVFEGSYNEFVRAGGEASGVHG